MITNTDITQTQKKFLRSRNELVSLYNEYIIVFQNQSCILT